jgi:hypothetical protein
MSILLWRRHQACSHGPAEYDRDFKTCSWVIQTEGMLPRYGDYKRPSAGTLVMADAERMAFYARELGSWDKTKKAVNRGLPLGGMKIHERIDEAIRVCDRLLLILSEHSMESSWVEKEISKARRREMKERQRMLFPIRLVGFKHCETGNAFDVAIKL